MLTIDDFSDFFAELYDGAEPYSWQSRVLTRLVETGQWPDSIAAPTGSGKSAVADIHVFARALAIQDGLTLPRRLVLVVGRRALVDSQAAHARRLQERLSAPQKSQVMEEIASFLKRESAGSGEVLGVSVVRGGITPDRGWIDHPTLTQILCMTPDMFGSRLLHQGYGEARSARPRSAGLLALDTAVVVDESHLNVQLSTTARRVREIVQDAPAADMIPPIQVVETTATPQPSTPPGVTVSEEELDLSRESDRSLATLLHASKPLETRGLTEWPLPRTGAARRAGIEAFASSAISIHSRAEGTIGVILNRVADAVAVADHIKKEGYRTVLRVGPMQQLTSMKAMRDHPTLLTPAGDADVDFLVATQTIEVGVDIDLHGMVTEIASAPALIQRFGRVNRKGRHSEAPITIIGPSAEVATDTVAAPYTADEVREAQSWIESILRDVADLSPANLLRTAVPASSPRRLVLERLSLADAELLSHTREDLFADADLDIWLADEMNIVEQTAGAIGRYIAVSPEQRLPLLQATRPQDHEVYPTTLARLREGFLQAKKARDQRPGGKGQGPVAYLYRESEWIAWEDENQRLQPGDVACFPSTAHLSMEGVFLPAVGADELGDSLSAWLTEPDLEGQLEWPRQRVIQSSHSAETSVTEIEAATLYQITQITGAGEEVSIDILDENMVRAGYDDWLKRLLGADLDALPTALRIEHAAADPEGNVQWAVLSLESPTFLTEESRQEWTSAGKVLLAQHQQDVAERALEMVSTLRLPETLVSAVVSAARHHDDGKSHPRFQARLGNTDAEGPLLAKSGRRKNLSASRTGSDGLPVGWRHEQLSVLLNADDDVENRDLILRLIGTTHGHGRTLFKPSAEQLCTGLDNAELKARAEKLFTEGEWDELMEMTSIHHRWWGASFLEAVLRAADCQVSGDGR